MHFIPQVTIHDLNQLDVVLTKGAFKRGQENPAWPEVANQTFGQSLTFLPKTRTEILGYDVSCQAGDIQFVMPNATFFGGNTYGASLSSPSLFSVTNGSRASVEYDMSDVPLNLRPRFNHIFANTSSGIKLFRKSSPAKAGFFATAVTLPSLSRLRRHFQHVDWSQRRVVVQ